MWNGGTFAPAYSPGPAGGLSHERSESIRATCRAATDTRVKPEYDGGGEYDGGENDDGKETGGGDEGDWKGRDGGGMGIWMAIMRRLPAWRWLATR